MHGMGTDIFCVYYFYYYMSTYNLLLLAKRITQFRRSPRCANIYNKSYNSIMKKSIYPIDGE